MGDKHTKETRQAERFNVDLPVEFRISGSTVAANVANIGTGGMCIKTSEVLPAKKRAFFRIVSGNHALQFNVEAEVIWSRPQSRIRQRRNKRPGMMGLRFVKSRFVTDDIIRGILSNLSAPQLA